MQRNYYVGLDGAAHLDDAQGSARHAWARLISPDEIVSLASLQPACMDGALALPPRMFVAAAERETGRAVNEIDVEPNGFTSRGLFQISNGCRYDGGAHLTGEDELGEVGIDWRGWDLLDAGHSIQAFALMMGRRRDAIARAAGLSTVMPPPSDLWFYLAIAHNEGLAAALKTIAAHGMDADAYKHRNGCCPAHATRIDAWDRPCDAQIECTPYGKRIGRYGDAYRAAAVKPSGL